VRIFKNNFSPDLKATSKRLSQLGEQISEDPSESRSLSLSLEGAKEIEYNSKRGISIKSFNLGKREETFGEDQPTILN
jgi:hypothetical protein